MTPEAPVPRRVARFLGLNASVAAMAVMVIFIGLGEKMAERFLPLYLLALGSGTFWVGFLNAMDNLLSALYSFPGGYLSDRLGYKRALILFTLVAMAGYLLVILIPSWPAVLIGAVFFISWTAVSLPAVMSLVAQVMPAGKRTMGVSIHSFVRRIPMALGPVLGGLLIGRYGRIQGVRFAFIVALVLGGAAIIYVWFFMSEDRNRARTPPRLASGFRYLRAPLRNLLLSDILIRFAEQIPYAFVVIWVVENNGLSPFQFGILTTIEMVTAMLVYIPVAYLADRYGKKRFVLMTFGFFTAFPLVLYFSRTFVILVLAFILRGLKGVRGADAQGIDYGPCAGRCPGCDVRDLLPRARRDCLRRSPDQRVALESLPGHEFPDCLCLWSGRDRALCPVRPGHTAGPTSESPTAES